MLMYLRSRITEIRSCCYKGSQITINIILFSALRGDQKAKNQNSLSQYGLTSQKQLQQAQQISSSLQNHNFGSFYPEFIRAFITLYLAGLIINLLHTQFFNLLKKRFTLQTCFGTFLMVFFHILDLLIINDYLILNSEYSNLTLAVSDIYVDSAKKQKDIVQLIEAVIRQLVNINRFLSMFFQGTSLWNDGIKKLIKNKRKFMSETQQQINQIPNAQSNNQKQEIISTKKKKIVYRKKRKKSNKTTTNTLKRKDLKQSPKQNFLQCQPQIEEQQQQLILSKQISKIKKDDFNTSTIADTNFTKSLFEQKIRTHRSQTLPIIKNQDYNYKKIRYSSQSKKSQNDYKRIINPFCDRLLKFSLQANVNNYEIKAQNIQEMNNQINKIAQENSWNSFLTINVKLNYWKEAYEQLQTQEMKEELQKIIAQYALYLMNQHSLNQQIIQ